MTFFAGYRLYTGRVLTENEARILNDAERRHRNEQTENSANSLHLTLQYFALSDR